MENSLLKPKERQNMNNSMFIPLDHAILMHREVHFGGNFDSMLEYYEQGRPGICPEFEVSRIRELAQYEKEIEKNLAELFLSEQEHEEVEEALLSYHALNALIHANKPGNPIPKLSAALILAESEEQIEAAIAALAAHKDAAVQAMIELLGSEQMHNPLFPGFGLAPARASQVLCQLGDKRAIIALFEALGREDDFFDEEVILSAFKSIGAPAKEFLLRLAKRSPIDRDSELAIIALVAFKDDEEAAQACWQLLHRADMLAHPILANYLALVCEGLKDPEIRTAFHKLSQDSRLAAPLRRDIATVAKSWEEFSE